MPLLKKKLIKEPLTSELFKDDDEVFYCELTGEIFHNYEDFAERMFLCTSMVWTCALTGKTNLTFSEAQQSEESARKCLDDLPHSLKIPLLFIATRTIRSCYSETTDDVFNYVRDRYFVDETVETCTNGTNWLSSKVIRVVATNNSQIKNSDSSLPINGNISNNNKLLNPPSMSYKYEVVRSIKNNTDTIEREKIIVNYSQIRRKRGQFSRGKCKLFIKHHTEANKNGKFIVKNDSINEFSLEKIKFNEIFDGPLPNFDISKKLERIKTKQEIITKFFQTKSNKINNDNNETNNNNNNSTNNNTNNHSKNNLIEQMKKRQDEFLLKKQQYEDEKLAEKQKKKDDDARLANYLREWYKPKEDLELEDHKKLPEPIPVKSRIPDEYLGDTFMIMEFISSFSKILQVKNFFNTNTITLDIIENSLLNNEVGGPFIRIIQMLLQTIFLLQDEEASLYDTQIENISYIKKEDILNVSSLTKATQLATIASKWSKTYQGVSLSYLRMDVLTTSEILRLHLLSSGARINDNGSKWRWSQRGYYCNEDDPGLYLCLNKPHILKALSLFNVVELSIDDKLTILSCLMDQILTFTECRDLIEKRVEQSRTAKYEMKFLKSNKKRRELEYNTNKLKITREENDIIIRDELINKLDIDNDKKSTENEKNIQNLIRQSYDYQIILGYDRAFRKYLKFQSLPGIFISWEDDNYGNCFNNIIRQNPNLVNGNRKDLLEHLRTTIDRVNTSDKENEPNKNNHTNNNNNNNSNNNNHKNNGVVTTTINEQEIQLNDLLLCTTNSNNCVVHRKECRKFLWAFYNKPEQIEQLLQSLNPRGIRENKLLQIINNNKDNLIDLINNSPVNLLNSDVELNDNQLKNNLDNKKLKKNRFTNEDLGFPIDMPPDELLHNLIINEILELEEKIYTSQISTFNINNDRQIWRKSIKNKNYKLIDKTIQKSDNNPDDNNTNTNNNNNNNNNNNYNNKKLNNLKSYLDPVNLLLLTTNIKIDDNLKQSDELIDAIQTLSIIIVQMARSIDQKYLKKPLGHANLRKKDKNEPYDLLNKWEQSLLSSTSFSQIFLHCNTLESSIMWSRTILHARCKICKRQRDGKDMLLCDSCNGGFHWYCLTPKLKNIPPGDWFCVKCEKEKMKEDSSTTPSGGTTSLPSLPSSRLPTSSRSRASKQTSKRRKLLSSDEENDDEEENDSMDDPMSEDSSYSEETIIKHKESDVESGICGSNLEEEFCKNCQHTGELIRCIKCSDNYHYECLSPPLRRPPRGPWTCNYCKSNAGITANSRQQRYADRYRHNDILQQNGLIDGQRRCAAKALYKIHNFAKNKDQSDTDNEDIYSKDSDDEKEEIIIRRPTRRIDDRRNDLPLHNAALQELLSDVMKYNDAWPFLRPVQKNEVPDYYDVITNPMDFGTIKYKLNMGKYKKDSELMKDVALVFQNCNTYNHTEDEIYQCGIKLLTLFQKKCKELGLKLSKELRDCDNDDEIPNKKFRTK